jgi:hypothetical protein
MHAAGHPSNLLTNSIAVEHGLHPFGVFEFGQLACPGARRHRLPDADRTLAAASTSTSTSPTA